MRRDLRACALAAVLVAGAARPAPGQTAEPPVEIDLQQFRPHGGAGDILGVESARVPAHLGWRVGLFFNTADDPLIARDASEGGRIVRLVDEQTSADLLVAIGLGGRVQLSGELPVLLRQRTDPMSPAPVRDADQAGLGDARGATKVQLADAGGVGAAASLAVVVPTGVGADFHSQGSLGLHPQIAVDHVGSGGSVAVNLGVRLRERRELARLTAGTELTWGVAARAPFALGGLGAAGLATLTGAVGLEDRGVEEIPVELLLAGEVEIGRGLVITAGGGPGLSRGYGTPDLRLFAGIGYRPASQRARRVAACPFGPEDVDGFEDGDDCGDPDNDGDRIADADDRCPNTPGAPGHHGCPARESVPPPEPEPGDRDDDGDGVVLADDACPGSPEDPDGFEDGDGCPDEDNDGDGIADADDQCPLRAEVVNQVDDGDGCPDQARTIDLPEQVRFDTGEATLRPGSLPILEQVARKLTENPRITKIRVDGHTDDVGDPGANRALSMRRAQSVAAYLIQQGVSARRLSARGFGDTRPLVPNDSPQNRETNRRVELTILEIDGQPVP